MMTLLLRPRHLAYDEAVADLPQPASRRRFSRGSARTMAYAKLE